MQQVITDLQGLQQRSRVVLVAQRLAVFSAWSIGIVLLLVFFDFAVRLPNGFRLGLLLAGLTVAGITKWVYVRPAIRFRPSLTQLALRVERVLPSVAGRLASSVEFAAAGMDQSNEMAARAVRDTQTRLSGETVAIVMNMKYLWRDVAAMIAMAAVALSLVVIFPIEASTGLQRLFLPYSAVKWPARTGVESLVTQTVHPRGQTLPLRAQITRGDHDQRVDAHYRLRINGDLQSWQRLVLTHQNAGAGDVHERLIDTNAAGAEAIEFYFATEDDETQIQQLALVPPPAVVRALLHVTPPAYANKFIPIHQAELGQGLDNRAVTESPILIGSLATLRLELNKLLPSPDSLAETFGWAESEVDAASFTIDPTNPAIWTLSWTVTETRLIALSLLDEHGLGNSEPITYRIEAIADQSPTVLMIEPQTDETVLPTAMVELRSEARDDVALASLSLESHVQTAGRSVEETMASAGAWSNSLETSEVTTAIDASLDLTPLHLSEGDTVLVSAVANDVFEVTTLNGGATPPSHEVRSVVRRLRVVGETDFASQLRRQLGGVRQNAIRIEAQQTELQEEIADNGMQRGSGIERAQGQLGERIAAQRASVHDIERLVRQNRLDDPQLGEILRQSNDLLDAAGRAANKAVEEMQKQKPADSSTSNATDSPSAEGESKNSPSSPPSQADSSSSSSKETAEATAPAPNLGEAPQPSSSEPNEETAAPPLKSKADQEIVEAQQEVRDELSDLIKLLDRDEDTWVVKRQLESLISEQAELEQATAKLGEQTVGRNPEDLTHQQRTDLDKIAQKQRDLRDEARKLIENMRQRAKAMEQVDSQSADSMRAAADTAEQRQLDSDMESAAQKAQQNQMSSAAASQQSAQSTMQSMLNDIDSTRRAQAQQLIRKLASLVESIERLITVQENELTSLALAKDTNNFGDLDRSMIRLNQNTQSVAGEARAAGAEARRIARALDRAADTQGAAVAAFRAQPINVEEAEEAENRSLELLKEAKQLAETLQKQTQDQEIQKRREELLAAYRGFAERQVAVRTETVPLASVAELDRRQLVEARRLGSSQDEIRTGLNGLRDVTSEILDSPIFLHVHRSIDGWSSAISDSLSNGQVNIDVTDRQQQIADSIGRLIKALEEATAPPDEFEKNQEQQQQQSGEGQSQQALIPPIAQLKLLREIQDQVYSLTKDLDGRSDLDVTQKRTRLREIGQQQRELMDLGKQMLEKLQQQQPSPNIEAPVLPDAPPVEPEISPTESQTTDPEGVQPQ